MKKLRKNLENDLGKNTRDEMVEICKDGLWAHYYYVGDRSWCGEQGIGQEDQSKHVEMFLNAAVPASKNVQV